MSVLVRVRGRVRVGVGVRVKVRVRARGEKIRVQKISQRMEWHKPFCTLCGASTTLEEYAMRRLDHSRGVRYAALDHSRGVYYVAQIKIRVRAGVRVRVRVRVRKLLKFCSEIEPRDSML